VSVARGDTIATDIYLMTSSNTHDPTGAGLSDDLSGLEILFVEDSGVAGEAMKDLLELLGADVVGPAATTAEAERLLLEHAPHVASGLHQPLATIVMNIKMHQVKVDRQLPL
jgi:hypothetical protein